MKKVKKIVLLSTFAALIGTGATIKINKDKADNFSKHNRSYIESFNDDDFTIIAHRGFSSLEVENSKEALKKAEQALYVDGIEFDVRLTSDDELVLAHDDSVYPNLIFKTSIAKRDFNYLTTKDFVLPIKKDSPLFKNNFGTLENSLVIKRNLMLLAKSYKIISLKEALTLCGDKKIFIDLKFKNNTKEFTKRLIDEIKDIDTSNITFISSNLLALLYLKKEKPNLNYAAIISKNANLQYLDLFDDITLKQSLVDYEMIKKLLDEDKNVAIWTINSVADIKNVATKLKDKYKDVIYITDYPDVMATTLNDIKEEKEKKLVK